MKIQSVLDAKELNIILNNNLNEHFSKVNNKNNADESIERYSLTDRLHLTLKESSKLSLTLKDLGDTSEQVTRPVRDLHTIHSRVGQTEAVVDALEKLVSQVRTLRRHLESGPISIEQNGMNCAKVIQEFSRIFSVKEPLKNENSILNDLVKLEEPSLFEKSINKIVVSHDELANLKPDTFAEMIRLQELFLNEIRKRWNILFESLSRKNINSEAKMANDDWWKERKRTIQELCSIFSAIGRKEEAIIRYVRFLEEFLYWRQLMIYNSLKSEISHKAFACSESFTKFFREFIMLAEHEGASNFGQKMFLEMIFENGYGILCLLNGINHNIDVFCQKFFNIFEEKISLAEILQAIDEQEGRVGESENNSSLDPRLLDVILEELVLIASRSNMYLEWFNSIVIKRSQQILKGVENKNFDPNWISFDSSEINDTNDIEWKIYKENYSLPNFDKILRKNNDEENSSEDLDLVKKQISKFDGTEGVLKANTDSLLDSYLKLEEYFILKSLTFTYEYSKRKITESSSNMIEDVLFIFKRSTDRAFATSSVSSIQYITNVIIKWLASEFKEVFKSQLNTSMDNLKRLLPSTNTALVAATLVSGFLPGKEKEGEGLIDAQIAVSAVLRDLEFCSTSFIQLRDSLALQTLHVFNQRQTDSEVIRGSLDGILTISKMYKVMLLKALSDVFQVTVKNQVLLFLEPFHKLSLLITESELIDYDVNDPFVVGFCNNITSLLQVWRGILTPTLYLNLIDMLVDLIISELESGILEMEINQLGGFQLDRDIRALLFFFQQLLDNSLIMIQTETMGIQEGIQDKSNIRLKFTKLTQISTLLYMETEEEIYEYLGPNATISLNWKLSFDEIKQYMKRRVDFKDIDTLEI